MSLAKIEYEDNLRKHSLLTVNVGSSGLPPVIYHFIARARIPRGDIEAANARLREMAASEPEYTDFLLTDRDLDILMSGDKELVMQSLLSEYAVCFGGGAFTIYDLYKLTEKEFLAMDFPDSLLEELETAVTGIPDAETRYAKELAYLRQLKKAIFPDERLLYRYLPCVSDPVPLSYLAQDASLEVQKHYWLDPLHETLFLGAGHDGIEYYLGTPDDLPPLRVYIQNGGITRQSLTAENDRRWLDETVGRKWLFTDSLMELLLTGDDDEVRRTFVSPNACYENGRIYTVYDLYFMDAAAFSAGGSVKTDGKRSKENARPERAD